MNKMNAIYVSVLALIVAVVALVMCLMCCYGQKPAAEVATPAVEASSNVNSLEAVKEVLNNNPEIVMQAMQKYEQNAREEAQKAAQEMIAKNIKEITNNPDSAVVGNPNGKITLVEFFDYSCGYCHRLYPALKNILAKNSDVRLVLRELTFVSPVSKYAAKAALAAKEQGKYQELWAAMMENDGQLTEARIDELAANAGINVEQMKVDMESAKVNKILDDTAALAGKIQINGVPSMVLDGKSLQTLDEEVIQNAINEARKN